MAEDKQEYVTTYKFKIANTTTSEIKLSCNKKNGVTLQENDTIKLIAKGSNIDRYTFDWRVDCDGRNVLSNGFKNGDVIKVRDLIEAPKGRTDEHPGYYGELYGKEIVLKLYYDNMAEDKQEYVTTYKFKIANNESIILSLDKKAGTVLNKEDVLRFTSGNYNGDFHCLVSIEEDGGWRGSYQKDLHEEDQIKVSDFIDYYSIYEDINLSGKRIKITIYSKKYGEYTNIAKMEIEYTIDDSAVSNAEAPERPKANEFPTRSWLINGQTITYKLSEKSGSKVKADDIIKFEAENYSNLQQTYYGTKIMYNVVVKGVANGAVIFEGSLLPEGDEIRIADIDEACQKNRIDIRGEVLDIHFYSIRFGEFTDTLAMYAEYEIEK